MPIYEYACKDCGEVLEVILRQGERQPRKCRKCSGKLEKLVSRTSFQLKGGGWFDSGYSRSGGGKSASESGSGSGSTEKEPKKKPKKDKADSSGGSSSS